MNMKKHAVKRWIAALLSVTLLTGIIPPLPVHAASFANMSGWAQGEVAKAEILGLIPARLAGSDLTKPATREEFCEIAVLLYEAKKGSAATPASPNPFTDTTNQNLLKAYNLKITSGTSATTFSPGISISREQVAVMFLNTIRALYPTEDFSTAGVPVFTDIGDVSSWATQAVLYTAKKGFLQGANGAFMPRGITAQQKATGYGTTKREQAIAIAVRIHAAFGAPTDTQAGNAAAVAAKERRIQALIKTTAPPSDTTRFDQIDFNTRFFRPTFTPKLTLEAIDPATGKGSSAPFNTLIRSNGSGVGSFRWNLPADTLSKTSKVVWQVSFVPFDGKPVTPVSKLPAALLLSGSTAPGTATFTVDFAKVKQADDALRKPSNLTFNSILYLSTLKKPTDFLSLSSNTQKDIAPRTYYVRAYPVDAGGNGIGDAGTGLPIIYGRPMPAHTYAASTLSSAENTTMAVTDPAAPSRATSGKTPVDMASLNRVIAATNFSVFTPTLQLPVINPGLTLQQPIIITPPEIYDFKLQMAKDPGKMTYGGEFPNNFVDKTEWTVTTNGSRLYSVTPVAFPATTTELRLQVSLSKFTNTSDNWLAPAGLVYETSLLASDPAFALLNTKSSQGLVIDFTKFTPADADLPAKEQIDYHIRVVALSPGETGGTLKAAYSNGVKIHYGISQAPEIKIYAEIKVTPRVPQVTKISYTPVRWEASGWQYHYVVTRQPTMREVFGGSSLVPDSPYGPMPVGAKIDMTPVPEDKSWWEDMWDAITSFFSDLVGFLGNVVNWVSKAYANLKTGLVAFVAANLPFVPDSLRDELQAALMAMVDYGLASIGIPPSLPNFDELSSLGVDYLAATALQQAGLPVDASTVQGVKDVGGAIVSGAKSATSTGGAPNPMSWDFVKMDPDYLYRPAYILIDLYNPYSEATPAGTLSGDVMKAMDLKKNGSDSAITYLWARYGSAWVTLFKPVYGQTIPSLAPGQHLTVPIFLEEFVGIPFAATCPPVDKGGFSTMYYGLGEFDYNFSIAYDLPSAEVEAKKQGMTEDAIYSYASPYQNISFKTLPTAAFSK